MKSFVKDAGQRLSVQGIPPPYSQYVVYYLILGVSRGGGRVHVVEGIAGTGV